MKTITLTKLEKESLETAGFSRQTIYKWTKLGVKPHMATRIVVRQIIHRDPWEDMENTAT